MATNVPSFDHEAPLVVLREDPALVPQLLRASLGLAVPAFTAVDVAEADFTTTTPVERRADLVLHLRDGASATPVMGLVVEVQRDCDADKRRSWPLYAALLHARLACPTGLVVLTADEAVARWAARPITTLQPGSSFVPLVLGPDRVPRLSHDEAQAAPWLAVLSALIHGNRPDGTAVTLTALGALSVLPGPEAAVCYDLIRASLDELARAALESAMHAGKYQFRSDVARHYIGLGKEEGRQEGRVEEARAVVMTLAARHGDPGDEVRQRIAACTVPEVLHGLLVDLAAAVDVAAVAAVIARLPVAAERRP